MTIQEIAKQYDLSEDQFQYRVDGRIEWVCEHGVGHTVYAPKIKQSDGSYFEDYSHGCDGCCGKLKKNEK